MTTAVQSQPKLFFCFRCNAASMRVDYHEAGMTLICMTCGDSKELTAKGKRYQPPSETPTGHDANYFGPPLPHGLRTIRFEIILSRRGTKRGTVDWSGLPPQTFTLAVNYYPTRSGSKWMIYNAECKPPLPHDLIEQDLSNLKHLLRDMLAETLPLNEYVQKTCLWEIDGWGHLTRRFD